MKEFWTSSKRRKNKKWRFIKILKILLSYYNGTNSNQIGFEATEEIRRYLSDLNTHVTIDSTETDNSIKKGSLISNTKISDKCFKIPENLWFITLETLTLQSTNECLNGKQLEVIPITQDEYNNVINNPFIIFYYVINH